MVTFCLGSARQKRDYFGKASGVIVLDNIEVLFCASENGHNYFAYGAVPFSEFRVSDYLKYKRALVGGKTDLSVLNKLGIPLKKRIGRLSAAQMRGVMFVEKTGGAPTEKTVIVNLDGAKYSRKNMRALVKLLEEAGDAYVCVTDGRFVSRCKLAFKILRFGSPKKSRPAFYSARVLGKRIGATRISVM